MNLHYHLRKLNPEAKAVFHRARFFGTRPDVAVKVAVSGSSPNIKPKGGAP